MCVALPKRNRVTMRLLVGLAALSMLTGCSAPEVESKADETSALQLPDGFEEAENAINVDRIAAHVAMLSSDEMEGRGPGTQGDERARLYLAEEMASMGLTPGFDGLWEQPISLVSIETTTPERWSFSSDGSTLDLDFWQDYIAFSGMQTDSVSIDDAELVFVGYGIQAPEYDWDDYKGVDLTGKVLLMLNNDPDWDSALFEGETRLYYGRWDYKYESAAAQGAVGAIIVHTTPSAGYPWQVVQTSWTGPQFELPAGEEARIRVKAWVTEEAATRLANMAGLELAELVESAKKPDFEPVPLGVSTSLTFSNSIEQVQSANVGGLLSGSDLADQVVVYTAHHDHFGIGKADAGGDMIYNGARDNASGCAELLTIAEAFTSLPELPRRSVLFLFVAAEEQGLLGSEYFVQNPTFEPGKIAANVNLDGANIWGRARDLTYIGYGKSSLDSVVEAAAKRQGRVVKGDQFPDRGHFYRSDQFNFAKIGVPAVYIDKPTEIIGKPEGWGREQMNAWEEVHYHQPSDEMSDTWDLAGAVDDTRVAFAVGLSIADAESLPSWKPGDEFEAARLAALGQMP
ncbi:MAG: M28 family peptidase [Acidobacteriota bacterium]